LEGSYSAAICLFMAQTFDNSKDLSKETHVLRAIRWGISAWEEEAAAVDAC
jgi:hypothetical protein